MIVDNDDIERESTIHMSIDKAVKEGMLQFSKATAIERFPDMRDGLKPVHRRIIYTMDKLGLTSNSGHIKSAQVVGEVMGKYHPHGDAGIYSALVRMAQPFSMNHLIIDPQGNFGNISGDSAASQRYTEVRLSKYARIFTEDLTNTSVQYVYNYDRRYMEPDVLPARLPNILINGVYGIGGAAFVVNIPPHNLSETIDAILKIMSNPKTLNRDLNLLPDFPTGGVIINSDDVIRYYKTGEKATMKVRGIAYVDGKNVVISALPYMKSADTIREDISNRLPAKEYGIYQVLDNCNGMHVELVIETTKNANPNRILMDLYEKKILENSLTLSFRVVREGRVHECDLKTIIMGWLDFRRDTVRKTIVSSIQSIYQNMHITEALILIYDNLQEVMDLIMSADDKNHIHKIMMEKYGLTIIQAKEISNMKLYELTKVGKDELQRKHADLQMKLTEQKMRLSHKAIDSIIKEQLLEYKRVFGRPRITKMDNITFDSADVQDIDYLLTLQSNNMLGATTSNNVEVGGDYKVITGYSKTNTTLLDGVKYNPVKDMLLGFSSLGYMYRLDSINNDLQHMTFDNSKLELCMPKIKLQENDYLMRVLTIPYDAFEARAGEFVILTTDNMIKRLSLSEIPKLTANGTRYYVPRYRMTVGLANVIWSENFDKEEVIYFSNTGEAMRIKGASIRPSKRLSSGVLATTNSNYSLIDIETSAPDDIYIIMKRSGICKVIHNSQISIKKRTSNMDKIINVVLDEAHDNIIRVIKLPITAKSICITNAHNVMVIDIVKLKQNLGQNQPIKLVNVNVKDDNSLLTSGIVLN